MTRLTNGTEYTFSIRAVNDQTETETMASLPSEEVTVTPNPVPAAPGNLRQDPAVTMGLNFGLSWDDPGDNSITKYEHRRSTDGGEIWDPDWQDTQGVGTGVAFESLEFDVTYTYQLRAVNDVGKGAVASISYTPRRNGAPGNMSGMSCDGNADGAGFGDAVSITSNAYGFDIVAAGLDPTDGSEWWQVEYMEPVADDLDTFHTAWFPAGCFEAVSDALADSIPATWPPVSGEWSFEASIDPNPLESGDENGARVTFTATYTVTSGAPTDLTASIDGDLARVSSVFPGSLLHDDGRIAIGLKLGGNSAGGSNFLVSANCSVNDDNTEITCTRDVLDGYRIFADANATPGFYDVEVHITNAVFKALASTDGHTGFTSATVPQNDIGEDGVLNLKLEVIPGPPNSPISLAATGGEDHRSVTLTWDDPQNPTITSYQVRNTSVGETMLVWTAVTDEANFSRYQFRQTTVVDDSDPASLAGNFQGVGWNDISTDSATTSHTVTGIDFGETHFFQVQYVKTDDTATPLDVDRTDSGEFGEDWTDLAYSGLEEVSEQLTGTVTSLVIGTKYFFQIRAANPGTAGRAHGFDSHTQQHHHRRTIAKSGKEVYKDEVYKDREVRDGSVWIWRRRILCSSVWSRCWTPGGPGESGIPFRLFCG